jgi:hypothetical protein
MDGRPFWNSPNIIPERTAGDRRSAIFIQVVWSIEDVFEKMVSPQKIESEQIG